MTHRNLFDPVRAGQLALRNRIVMAPLTRNRAPGAVPTALMAEYYAQRAGAGLIVTEATSITQQGQGYADVPGLYTPEQLEGWAAVTRGVHARGGCIVSQMFHVGRISHVELQAGGAAPVAPSAVTAKARTYLLRNGAGEFVETSAPRALDAAELPGIVEDFRRAASNALHVAGFDGVEVHAANGYLLDQFLQRSSNRRDDAYGGSIENRSRLLLETVKAVVGSIGGGRVGVRLSPVSPGNDMQDPQPQDLFEYVVRQLAPLGLAYLHVIEGAAGGDRELADRPFDYVALRSAYRTAGGRGAWMVNNGYGGATAQSAVSEGADLVAFGRPFISNPDLVDRLRSGAPLAKGDPSTFYGGGARGYTDYPALSA